MRHNNTLRAQPNFSITDNDLLTVIVACFALSATIGMCCFALLRVTIKQLQKHKKNSQVDLAYRQSLETLKHTRELSIPIEFALVVKGTIKATMNQLIPASNNSTETEAAVRASAQLLSILSTLNPYEQNAILVDDKKLRGEYEDSCDFFTERLKRSQLSRNELYVLSFTARLLNTSIVPQTKTIIKQTKYKHSLNETLSISDLLFQNSACSYNHSHNAFYTQSKDNRATLSSFRSLNKGARLNHELSQLCSKKITADELTTYLNLIDTARLPREDIKLSEIRQTLTALLPISQNSQSANEKKDKAQAAWDSIARIICIHGALYQSPEIINSINMSPLALSSTSINTSAETVIELNRSSATF